jgi:hypothetical protein
MVISYHGRGWIVGVIAAGCLLLADVLTRLHFHDPDYYEHHGWPKLAAFWTAALLVQIFVRSGEDDEVLGAAEAASSQKKQPTGRDVLFGIPVKYWPVLLLALGVGYYYLG